MQTIYKCRRIFKGKIEIIRNVENEIVDIQSTIIEIKNNVGFISN
jgi:hypothetical protein